MNPITYFPGEKEIERMKKDDKERADKDKKFNEKITMIASVVAVGAVGLLVFFSMNKK